MAGRAGLALAALVALAGCTAHGGAAGGGASPGPATDARLNAMTAELVACIRGNGVPEFPDVHVENGRPADPSLDPAVQARAEAALDGPCKPLVDRLNAATGNQGGNDATDAPLSADELAKARRFAQCVREHGVPEWPDPDQSGNFHIGGTSIEPLFQDKANGMPKVFSDAQKACEEFTPNSWGIAR